MSNENKNNKGLNEKKSNQEKMKSHVSDTDEQVKEKNSGKNKQEKTEGAAGSRGQISGDSFNKNIPKEEVKSGKQSFVNKAGSKLRE